MCRILLNILMVGTLTGFNYRWITKSRPSLLPSWLVPGWFFSIGILFLSISGYLLLGDITLNFIYMSLFPTALGVGWIIHYSLFS